MFSLFYILEGVKIGYFSSITHPFTVFQNSKKASNLLRCLYEALGITGVGLKYRVKWKALTFKLSKFMFVAMIAVVVFSLLVRAYKLDLNMTAVFEHIEVIQLPLYVVGLYLACLAFSALIRLCLSTTYITLSETTISGRNYWMCKRYVRLASIKRIYPFSDNGINAMVVDGGGDGSVYISTHTENYENLVEQMADWVERHA